MMSVYAYGTITEIKGKVYTIFYMGDEGDITFNGNNIKKIAVGDKFIDTQENNKTGKIKNYNPSEVNKTTIKYDDNSVPPDFVDLKYFLFPIDKTKNQRLLEFYSWKIPIIKLKSIAEKDNVIPVLR